MSEGEGTGRTRQDREDTDFPTVRGSRDEPMPVLLPAPPRPAQTVSSDPDDLVGVPFS